MVDLGFKKSLSEFTLYIKKVDDEILVVSLYVDDLLVTGSSKKLIDKFKEEMKDAFEMTNLERRTFFLGMQVQQKQNEICVPRKICKGSPQEVQHGRVQANCNSNESK